MSTRHLALLLALTVAISVAFVASGDDRLHGVRPVTIVVILLLAGAAVGSWRRR